MWESAYQDGGGGFDQTNNMFASPPPTSGKSGSTPKALAPVAIKQLLDCPEDGLKIKDIDVQVVKVVGIIKSVEKSTIKVSYMLEDSTGIIQGIAYLESDSVTTLEASEPVIEDTYCIMIGSVRSQSGTKHIMIYSISPITDFNEIIEHYLSVIHLALKAETMDNTIVEQKEIKQEMLSSYGTDRIATDRTSGLNSFDMDPKIKRLYEIVSGAKSESGISMDEICTLMSGKLSRDKMKIALDYLAGEGLIFTTIDECHYKVSD